MSLKQGIICNNLANVVAKSKKEIKCSCWFCIYFKRLLFGTPFDDCFCNAKKIFLTTVMYMATRDAFTAAKNPHRIDLKRYLINRSSRVLLILICQNCLDQGGNSCYFKEKGSWLLPKFIQIITQSLSR